MTLKQKVSGEINELHYNNFYTFSFSLLSSEQFRKFSGYDYPQK